MKSNALGYVMLVSIVANIFLYSAYDIASFNADHRYKCAMSSLDREERLERQNAILRAEIISLRLSGKESPLDESERTGLHRGWELRP